MWDLIPFIFFILILASLIYKDRKKAERHGILLIRKTKKGRNFIDKIEKKSPRLWNLFSFAGIIIAIPAMIIISLYLLNIAILIFLGQADIGGAGLLLPGPVSTPVIMPGLFIVPWWIWVIGVFTVMVPHEFSHGIMCRLEKIRIKSVGWLLFLFIPGAFVEPDEKQLKRSRKLTKLKVYAAGSFANFLVALSTIAIFYSIIVTSFHPSGMLLYEIAPGTPANITGISGTILAIGNTQISSIEDLSDALSGYGPGDEITITTTDNNYQVPVIAIGGRNIIDFIIPDSIVVNIANETTTHSLTLTEHPEDEERGYIGITSLVQTYSSSINLGMYFSISNLLIWIFIFNLGIGLFNLLSIKPLDGGFILETLLGKRKKTKLIVKIVSFTMLFLLLFNLIGPFFM